jgi:hypothetical protein
MGRNLVEVPLASFCQRKERLCNKKRDTHVSQDTFRSMPYLSLEISCIEVSSIDSYARGSLASHATAYSTFFYTLLAMRFS